MNRIWNRSASALRKWGKLECRRELLVRVLRVEWLEERAMFAAAPAPLFSPAPFRPTLELVSPAGYATPVGHGLNPTQIRHAYGMDQVTFGSVIGDGTGQTIAIIDTYHSPTVVQDLQTFDATFGLPDPPQFRVVAQDGSTNFPRTDPSGPGTLNWEEETALDVEWAHAMAPQANILLVEANAPTYVDLIQTAVDYARRQPGVVAISMSFGGGEFSGETSLDSYFTTPAGHSGVTFLASSGDSGNPGGYPAASSNVVSVGGTRLSVDAAGNYLGESGWSGSGGGVSTFELLPSYQNGIMSGLWHRGLPDIALDADPNTGVPVYCSYNQTGGGAWLQIGGTSFSSPAWAGIIAVTDQGRSLQGLPSLDGATQTLPLLYSLPDSDFHDIVAGNNGFAASTGYDLVTGRGSPIANLLIPGLISGNASGGGGSGGGGGTTSPPVNDSFAKSVLLTGVNSSVLGTNIGATQQAGEPNAANVSGGRSVWWTWTAPASGTVAISTMGSDFDTTLGVYTGSAVNALTRIAANDDQSLLLGILTSRVSWTASAGTTYRILVDGYHGATGHISLNVAETVVVPVVPPANNMFASRIKLTGSTASTTAANAGATREAGEPLIAGMTGGHSTWWTWTAPAGGSFTITTAGSDFDTLLGVYAGTAVNRLTLVGSNDDQNYGAGILTSRVVFNARAGTAYQIAVDGWHGATGHILLAIAPTNAAAAAPASTAILLSAWSPSQVAAVPAQAAAPLGVVSAGTETGSPTPATSSEVRQVLFGSQGMTDWTGNEFLLSTRVVTAVIEPISGSSSENVDLLLSGPLSWLVRSQIKKK